MTAPRTGGDLSTLPTVTFGHRDLMWWGTLGFMVIEGWTLLLIAVMYLYLRQNFNAWPPAGTPDPSLLIPSINLVVMLVSMMPAWIAARAAKRLDVRRARIWLTVLALVSLPVPVLRWYEFWALNTRWDQNAYATAAWTLVGVHTTLLALDVADTLGLAILYWVRRMPIRVVSDVADNSFYWYFMVLGWVPLYLIVYVGPRIL
jgi:cytochrome c oxidase subunit 3